MAKPSKKKQQTLEATLGRPRVKPAVITPRKATPTKGSPSKNSVVAMPPPPAAASSSSPGGNFMTSSQVILSSARKTRSRPSLTYLKELDQSSSAAEDKEDELPVRSTRQTPKGKEKAVVISDDDDEDELPTKRGKSTKQKSKGKEKAVVISDEDDDEEEEEDQLPTKRGKSRGTKTVSTSSSSASPSPAKESTPKQKQQAQQDEDEDEDDEDDLPIVTPVTLRFNRKRRLAVDSDDSDDQPLVSSPVKKRRLIRRGSSPVKQQQSDSEEEVAPTPRLRSSQTPRKPLSAKQRAQQMLRRRYAGETIIEEDEEEEDEEDEVEPRKALYDTDSDNLALSEFEDEEDEEQEGDEGPEPSQSGSKKTSKKDKNDKKKKKKTLKKLKGDSDDEGTEAEAEDLDDFVVQDDSDEPMGAPEDIQMPLQFTHHARKKLIEHFRDVVEWLVLYKIIPGFAEKTGELYRIGWQKLDDEVRALATSKFTSSVWKPDFYKALRARPQYTSIEVGASAHDSVFGANCEACGRSGHPATWTISFSGTPYVKRFGMDFLDPIEPPSDSDSSSEASSQQASQTDDVDEDGNTIPPEDKTFYVGVVCNGNAEIAHTLIHWKHALQDWVESQLMAEGYMQPAKLAEREGMKLKKKYKLVDRIVEGWVADGKVRVLFGEFKSQLERARNQQTTGRGYRRG
ncbi:hypothetical protein QBC41DRAFT_297936 [Cercophora samala]|uniref:DUF4211 domain-containing protein n=1 Tax=Cercophora samala TaxID=330535 RepID=A0AA39ZNA3_9PEZI|nr:hypothetical protein QBC41DRAFT_297936 [Cercophora samala]